MSSNFRGRLFRFFATDVTWLVRGLWKMAHRMVDEFTNQKLLIYGNDYQTDLHALVSVENLEEKYGGKLPNKTDNFWPPQMWAYGVFRWQEESIFWDLNAIQLIDTQNYYKLHYRIWIISNACLNLVGSIIALLNLS